MFNGSPMMLARMPVASASSTGMGGFLFGSGEWKATQGGLLVVIVAVVKMIVQHIDAVRNAARVLADQWVFPPKSLEKFHAMAARAGADGSLR